MNIFIYAARESTPERPLYKARGTLGELRVWVGPFDDAAGCAACLARGVGAVGDFVIATSGDLVQSVERRENNAATRQQRIGVSSLDESGKAIHIEVSNNG